MKTSILALVGFLGATLAAPIENEVALEERASTVKGFDISGYQPHVDFSKAHKDGARFVIIKATEGTSYRSPAFSTQYAGATKAKMVRGAYHFAQPASSSGASQAKYFHKHGGGWSNDGITLPGMLDIEYNPHGSTCYGLSHKAMVSWIKDFVTEYHKLAKRYPMIYSTNDWWTQCTGNSKDFSKNSALVLARYGSSPGTLPGGWKHQTIWQNNDHFPAGGDSDVFRGSLDDLKKFAKG